MNKIKQSLTSDFNHSQPEDSSGMRISNQRPGRIARRFSGKLIAFFGLLMLFGMLSLIHPLDAFAQTTIQRAVAAESDDAEEEGVGGSSPGSVYLDSSDLELVRDDGSTQGTQQVGIRFTNITVPPGAVITDAYITFTADDAEAVNPSNSSSVTLTINGHDDVNSSTFTTASNNISLRTKTTALTSWTPTSWITGNTYDSAPLTSIVQEIIGIGGWSSGNAMSFIVTGPSSGGRTADSFNVGNPPVLTISYSTLPPLTLSATVTDATCPATGIIDITADGTSPYTYTWTNDKGDSGSGSGLSITGLDSATYDVVVTDTPGASGTLNTTVGGPAPLAVSFNTTYLSAPGASDGAIDITASGGVPIGGTPYTYSWTKDGGAPFSTSEDLTGLSEGLYEVSVTDDCPTTVTKSVYISDSVVKQLYLSDTEALDRIDPVATSDATTATTSILSTAPAGVVVDATTTGFSDNPGSTTFTVSHTVGTGKDRLLLVGISQKNKLVDSVTYGGTPMSLVGETITNGNARQHIYSLVNPPSGTADVVVTLSANPDKGIVVGAVSFTGVDQSSPLGTFVGAEDKTTNATVTVSSAPGELVFDVATARNTTFTADAGQTGLYNINSGDEIEGGGASTKPGAASVTMGWTLAASQDWAIGAVPVKPAVAIPSVSFTQSPAVCSDLIITQGTVNASTFITVDSGSMPANPDITATLSYAGNTIITLTNPSYNSGTGELTWSGALGADVTVLDELAIELDITTAQAGVTFSIDYDSSSDPSKVDFPVATYIEIISYEMYDAAYPNGNLVSNGTVGDTVYMRTVVTDPFGSGDITALFVDFFGTTFPAPSVATTDCTRTYEYSGTIPAVSGNFSLLATAYEGYEITVTDTDYLNFDVCVDCPPTANDDFYTINQGESERLLVLDNDTDPNNNIDITSITITVPPSEGGQALPQADGSIIYVPNGSFLGEETFTYQVCDDTSPTLLCDTAVVTLTVLEDFVDVCAEANRNHDYYLPFPAADLYDAFPDAVSCPGNLGTNLRTVIAIKAPYPGTVIVYDHWEDGFEANPENPVQLTTETWGDGNLYNGVAPGFETTDLLPSGASIVIDTTFNYSARTSATIEFDGRDKLITSSDIALSKISGDTNAFTVQSAKTDVYDTNRFGTSFVVPFGENLGGEFQYTSLFIRAATDNTSVTVDVNGDGVLDGNDVIGHVLNEGEVLFIEGNPGVVNAINDVRSGALVTASAPVGLDVLFGGLDCYGTRNINILPGAFYSNVYYTPVPTTDVDEPNAVYLYNGTNSSMDVDVYDNAGLVTTLTVGSKVTLKYILPTSTTTGYKFVNEGGESFTIIEVMDSPPGANGGSTFDWSISLIAENRLTDFTSIAWAPGSVDYTTNTGPLWITPTAATTLYVKYDGDLIDPLALESPCGIPYDYSVALNELDMHQILDSSDNDQSGVAVYTCDGTTFAAVYGEDSATASTASPSLDVGTLMQPMCKENNIFAVDDFETTPPNTPVLIGVPDNDFGFLATVDTGSVDTIGLLAPSNGTISINPDGTILYTPNTGYLGEDTFEYRICSNEDPDLCDVALVTILITDCNANANNALINGYTYLELQPDNGAYDGESFVAYRTVDLYSDTGTIGIIDGADAIIQTTVSGPGGNYTFAVTATGNYIAKANVSDGEYLAADLDEQAVNIAALNTCGSDLYLGYLPVLTAIDDSSAAGVDQPQVIDILDNDLGVPDPSTVTTTGLLQPGNGTVVINLDGTVTYYPDPGYVGNDTFEYQVCSIEDPGLCDIALVTVTVSCVFTPGENSVFGTVFWDENLGASFDAGEARADGVTVNLYEDFNNDGSPDGAAIQTTTTDAFGNYDFSITGLVYETPGSYDQKILASTDDAAEKDNGDMKALDENTLKFGDKSDPLYIGLRFTNVTVPANATINSAYVYLAAQSDQNSTDIYEVTITAQDDTKNPATFADVSTNISVRSQTTASVGWNMGIWDKDLPNPYYQSPDIKALITEVKTDVAGLDDDELVLVFAGDPAADYNHTAFSWDGDPTLAPRLVINYTVPGDDPYYFLTEIVEPAASTRTTSQYQATNPDFAADGTGTCGNDFGLAQAELVTVKTLASADTTPNEGDTVSFLITVTNTGPTIAQNVSLSDLLPTGITYTGDTPSAGSYNFGSGLWDGFNLGIGGSATLTLTGTVDSGQAGNTVQNITSAATSDQPDPSTTGDDLEESVIVNLPPIATDNDSLGNSAGAVVQEVILENDGDGSDNDPDGSLNTASIDLDPATTGIQKTFAVSGQGTWTEDGAGNVTFTPEGGFTGDPTPITYTIEDDEGLVSNTATITVDYVPVAANDSSTDNAVGDAVTVNVLTNDTAGDDVDPTTVQIVGTASQGDPLVVAGEGTWSVNPTTGAITFTPCVAVGPDCLAGAFTGDPTDITYTVDDDEGNISDPATVSVDYVNDTLAENDINQTPVNVAVSGDVSTNDTDAQGDTQTVTSALADTDGDGSVDDNLPLNTPTDVYDGATLAGSMTLIGDGTYTFTPATGYTGTVPFEYTVTDNNGDPETDTATLTIEVFGDNPAANDPPIAQDDTNTVEQGGTVTSVILSNDSDPEGDTLTVTSAIGLDASGNPTVTLTGTLQDVYAEDPANPGTYVLAGQASIDGSGNVIFTADAGFVGDVPVDYTISDGNGGTDSAVLTITVEESDPTDNDTYANDDANTGIQGVDQTGNILTNDYDPELDTQVVASAADSTGAALVVDGATANPLPSGGTLVLNTDGTYTYSPDPAFVGTEVVTYTACDNGSPVACDTATLYLTTLTGAPPVAVDDASLANPAGPVTLNALDGLASLGNVADSDADGNLDPATVDLDPATPGIQKTLVVAGEGTWTEDGAGNVTFTPDFGFTDDPTPITYTVSDDTGLTSNEATITIDYVPVATDDSSTGNTPNNPTPPIDVVGNDTTGDEVDPTTVQITGTALPGDTLNVPGEGTWTVNPTTGAITFTPEPGFTGDPTDITYTVDDDEGNTSAPATVHVDYDILSPVAVNDLSSGNPAGAVSLDPTADNGSGVDSDPDGVLDPTTVSLVAPVGATNVVTDANGDITSMDIPGEGTWSVDLVTGLITFIPEAGFTDDPTPQDYNIEDNDGNQSNNATVTIDYVPVATDDSSTDNTVGDPAVVDVLSNDTTGDIVDPTTVQIVGTASPGDSLVVPGEGTWSVNPSNGEITFTPEPGFTADPADITYTVDDDEGNTSAPATVSVDYANDTTAENDINQTPVNTPVSGDVSTNDTDAQNDGQTVQSALADTDGDGIVDDNLPLNTPTDVYDGATLAGSMTLIDDGTYTFTPAAGYTGTVPFEYTVVDDNGDPATDSATLTIEVLPVPDPIANDPPVAQDDTNTVEQGDTVTSVILSNDSDPDGDTLTVTVATGLDASGNPTVTLNGTPQNVYAEDPANPGTYVLAGQASIDGSGNVIFTADAGFAGDVPVDYTISDGNGGTDSAVLTITVEESDPTDNDTYANDDANTGIQGDPQTGNILTNDNDPEGDDQDVTLIDTDGDGVPDTAPTAGTPITITEGGTPIGTLTLDPETGAYLWEPEPDFIGTAVIPYTATDDNASPATDTATLYLTTLAGAPPVAQDDEKLAQPAGNVSLDPTADNGSGVDSDPDGTLDPATVSLVAPVGATNVVTDANGDVTSMDIPGEGTWSVDLVTGEITFAPLVTFTDDPTPQDYNIEDDDGNVSNDATITIDYVPVATNDSSTGNTPNNPTPPIDVVGNDTTGDEVDPTTVQITGTALPGDTLNVPGEGTWTVNPTTGAITFTPEPGFTGDPTDITYTVDDDEGNTSAPATVHVDYDILSPVAVNDLSSGNPAGAVSLDPTADNGSGVDSDPDGVLDPTTVSLVAPVGATNVVTDANGDITSMDIPGEGTWSVDLVTGLITFIPEAGFTDDPTPQDYNIEDNDGNQSNNATVTIDYVPVATDDSSTDNTVGDPAVVDVLSNDTTGDIVDPTTVQIVGTASPGDSLVVPGEGTWSVNPSNGEITFTPEPGFTADPADITYTVDDDEGNTSAPATVSVDYANDTTAENDINQTPVNTPVSGDVSTNDTDAQNDGQTVQSALADTDGDGIVDDNLPLNTPTDVYDGATLAGSMTLIDDGTYTFTPAAGYTGTVPFEYTVVDDNGDPATDSATLTIEVLPVPDPIANDPPVAQDDTNTVEQGDTVTSVILSNDSDPDGDTLTVTVATGLDASGNPTVTLNGTPQNVYAEDPANPGTYVLAGQASIDGSGNVIFTADAGFAGDVPVDYTISDGNGGTDSAVLTITVEESDPTDNDTYANDDANTGIQGDPQTGNILTNDNDPEGDDQDVTLIDTDGDGVPDTAPTAGTPITITEGGTPIGTLTLDPETGAYLWEPEPDFIGTAVIPYTATDDNASPATDTATLYLTTLAGAPPVAQDDEKLAQPAGNVSLDPTADNGSGVDSDPDGTLDPATVSLVAPVGATNVVTDANGDVTSMDIPGEGTWSVDLVTGEITFAPLVTFTDDPTPQDYNIEDDDGNVSNDATITIDYVPVATNDSSTGNTPNNPTPPIDVVGNDTTGDEVDPTTVQITGTALPGDTLNVPGEGTWTVNPTTGAITFTPEPGFTGDPTDITYTVDDDEGNTSAPATVHVDYDILSPVAVNDLSSGNPAGAVSLDPTADNGSGVDSDPDGVLDPTTVSLVAPVGATNVVTDANGDITSMDIPGEGTWSVDLVTGLITFIPEAGFTDDPTPQDYNIEDNDGNQSNNATVTIDYVPVATDDSSTDNTVGDPAVVDVLSNDTTGDIVDPTTVQIVGTASPGDSLVVPGEGTWSVNPSNGEITFTPEPGFTADPADITYTVDDDEGNTSAPATVSVDYTNTTLAQNDINQTPVNILVSGDVLTNDSDSQGDNQTVTAVLMDTDGDGLVDDAVAPGTIETVYGTDTDGNVVFAGLLVVETDGSYSFYPTNGFTGTVPAEYTATDDNATPASDTATLTIEVFGDDPDANDPPVAQDDTNSTEQNTPVSANVIVPNDSDPDGDPLTVTDVLMDVDGDGLADDTVPVGTLTPVYGTDDSGAVVLAGDLVVNIDGSYTYTPNATFTGEVPAEYTIEDPGGLDDDATLTITVVPDTGNATFANDDANSGVQGVDQTGNILTNDNDPELDDQDVSLIDTDGDGIPDTLPDGTPQTITEGAVTIGTLTLDPETGDYTWTPAPDFVGTAVIPYIACDEGTPQACDAATLYLTTLAGAPPVAVDDSDPTPNDPGTIGQVSAATDNDSDPDSNLDISTVSFDPTSVGGVGSDTDSDGDFDQVVVSGQGTWTVDENGNVTFTPEAGFNGDPDPIEYTVSDATGLISNEATITMDYVPVATDDSSIGNVPGAAVIVDVTSNDLGGDIVDPQTVSLDETSIPGATCVTTDIDDDCIEVNVPGEGTWTVDETTGAITFTPDLGFTGDPTPIDYTVEDDEGNISDPATVTVDYGQAPPVAVDDTDPTPNAPGTNGEVSAATDNDSDVDGDLDVTTVSFDPTSVGGIGTDTDSDGDIDEVVVAGQGTWTVDESGNVTFTPEAGFNDDPTPIEYTVNDITGLTSNEATITMDYVPVATDDSSAGNTAGDPVTVDVLDNDTDGDIVDPTTVQIVGTAAPGDDLVVPGQGTWSVDPVTGDITFTPEPGFTGDPDDITYTVDDNEDNTSAPATVSVDYANDTLAENDINQTPVNVPVNGDVLTNDSDAQGNNQTVDSALVDTTGDGTPDTALTVGTPITVAGVDKDGLAVTDAGTLTLNLDGTYDYVPATDFTGTVSAEYTVIDDNGDPATDTATLTIEVIGAEPDANDPPVAQDDTNSTEQNTPVSANVIVPNDSDPDGDPLTVTAVLMDTDGDGLADDSVLPGTTTTVYGTDDSNTVVPAGTLVVNADGSYTYTPNATFTGEVPAEYTIEDPGGLDDDAKLTITVLPDAGNATFANDDANSGLQGDIQTGNILANDSDPEADDQDVSSIDSDGDGIPDTTPVAGTPVTITQGGTPIGTLEVDPETGAYIWTPEPDFVGTAVIPYTATDGTATDTATLYLTTLAGTPPVAVNDEDPTPNDPGTIGEVSAATDNDSDPDGNLDISTVSFDPTSVPGGVGTDTDSDGDIDQVVGTEGTWEVDESGNVTFTPAGGFVDDPTPIEYTVNDTTDLTSNVATITVDYVPVATDDISAGNLAGTPVIVDVTLNDDDGDSVDPTTVSLDENTAGLPVGSTCVTTDVDGDCVEVDVPGEGTWTVDETTGAITFTPDLGFTGDPTPIDYTVEDDEGNISDPATVTVDYGQAPPVAVDDADPTPNAPGTNGEVSAVTDNDSDADGDLDVTTVSFDPTSVPGGVGTDTDSDGDVDEVVVPGQGTWTVDESGNVTFTPEGGFNDDPTPIEYTVNDTTGLTSNEATITMDYVPVATDDSSVDNTIGDPVTVDVLANDLDGDVVDPTTVQIVGTASPGDPLVVDGEGTWTVDPVTGAITFTPCADGDSGCPSGGFVGDPTDITYTVDDVEGNTSDPATVNVDYAQAPVAVDDADPTPNDPGTVGTVVVTDNDTDPDNDLDVSTVSFDPTSVPGGIGTDTDSDTDIDEVVVPGEGTWTVDETGNVTFTPCVDGDAGCPAGGFTNDPTPIEYTVNDATGLTSNEATITVDYVPVATDDSSPDNVVGTPVTVDVVANDTGGDVVDPTTVSIVGGTDTDSNGTLDELVVPGEGTWIVDPVTGEITFTPCADGDAGCPAGGYTGDPTDITYTVEDDDGNTSAPATVNVDYGNTTLAENDINQTPVNIMVSGDVLTNDTDAQGDTQTVAAVFMDLDGDGLADDAVAPGSIMEVYGTDTDGNVVSAGYLGVDANGSYTFGPAPDFTGTVPAVYTVTDDNGDPATDTATLTIEVYGDDPEVNDPPVAQDDTNSTEAGVTVGANVILPNDTDPEGDALTVVSGNVDTDGDGVPDTALTVDGPAIPVAGVDDAGAPVTNAGTLTLNSDGSYTFTPNPDIGGGTPFTGTVVSDYTISDGNGGTDSATLTITVVPDAGNNTFANDDANSGPKGEDQTGNLLDNDNDPEGDVQAVTDATDSAGNPLTVDGTTPNALPSGGTLVVNLDGTYTYTPDPAFVGTEVVEYTACDAGNPQACDTATLYLTTIVKGLVPDLSPAITVQPNVMIGPTSFEVWVECVELLIEDTSGTTTLRVPKDNRWTMTSWDPGATNLPVTGFPVNNVEWTLTQDATAFIFTTNTTITGGTQLNFGFTAAWDAAQTSGTATYTVNIDSGSGGEVRTNNNASAASADYTFSN